MTVTERPVLDRATLLANIDAIAPTIRAEADEGERRARLTERAVAALRAAGVFGMSRPRAWGGPELDICTQLEAVEAVSRADGSAGWCVMIGSDGGFISARLDDDVGRALYREPDAVTAGWVQPGGRLEVVDGGFRLSGRWQFASGCTHADVMIGGAIVCAGGEPVLDGAGRPEVRIAALPADRFEIIENWATTGLAGSGSHDYAAHDEFVPAAHTFHLGAVRRPGPLYAWPGLFTANHAGVPLGIAGAALDVAADVLDGKVLMPDMRPARDEPRVRRALARAHALVGSARAYAYDVVGEVWATLVSGDELTRPQRAALGGVPAHTARACREAVELLADASGTDAIRRSCVLERHRRDLSTIAVHVLAQERIEELVGGLWLEHADIDHPLIAQRII